MKKVYWYLSNNQFKNVTKKSLRKAYKLSLFHDRNLFQKTIDFPLDADWAMLYARYHSEHLAYVVAYTNWKASGGSLSGNTQTLNELFALIPKMLDKWVSMILPIYDRASAKFKSFFPLGHKPFQKGSIDERIVAISTLSTTIGTDVSLASVKTVIDADHLSFVAARDTQEGGKTSKKSLSEAVEAARVDIMDLQYGDAGFLINKFFKTPKSIESVFDLQTLKETMQSYFTKTMKTSETYSLTKNTFAATDEIRGKVADAANPTDKVTLYLGSTLGGIDSPSIDIINNTDYKFAASEFLVDLASHTFLTAVTDGNITNVKLAVELY